VCYTIGWDFAVNGKGIKKNSGIYTGKVEIMNKFQCYKSLNTYGQDHRQSSGEHNSSRGMICAAGHATEDDKFCEDDAGGPLLCESNGHAVLAGITSKGLNCSTKKRLVNFQRNIHHDAASLMLE
jgi:secreted trypsin-like serine protease